VIPEIEWTEDFKLEADLVHYFDDTSHWKSSPVIPEQTFVFGGPHDFIFEHPGRFTVRNKVTPENEPIFPDLGITKLANGVIGPELDDELWQDLSKVIDFHSEDDFGLKLILKDCKVSLEDKQYALPIPHAENRYMLVHVGYPKEQVKPSISPVEELEATMQEPSTTSLKTTDVQPQVPGSVNPKVLNELDKAAPQSTSLDDDTGRTTLKSVPTEKTDHFETANGTPRLISQSISKDSTVVDVGTNSAIPDDLTNVAPQVDSELPNTEQLPQSSPKFEQTQVQHPPGNFGRKGPDDGPKKDDESGSLLKEIYKTVKLPVPLRDLSMLAYIFCQPQYILEMLDKGYVLNDFGLDESWSSVKHAEIQRHLETKGDVILGKWTRDHLIFKYPGFSGTWIEVC